MKMNNKTNRKLIYLISIFIFLSLACSTVDKKPKEKIGYLKDNADGTIEDTRFNYTWQRCSMGQTQNENCDGNATQTNWLAAM